MEKISIIIPYKEKNEYVEKCIKELNNQDYEDFEIIEVPDSVCPGTPAKKRNWAVKKSKGEILAFIDSDAYPVDNQWLTHGTLLFKDTSVGVIGGPQLNPPDSSFLQNVSGKTMSLGICSGGFADRYKIGKKSKEVDELPSANLFVRRTAFVPFDESILTGEDAKLCMDIKKNGFLIMYLPDIPVYHHRRKNVLLHTKQMFQYGYDKAKVLKTTGYKLTYFIPTLFMLFLLIGWVEMGLYQLIIGIYLLIVLTSSLSCGLKYAGWIIFYTILTHISYGVGFFLGLFRKK